MPHENAFLCVPRNAGGMVAFIDWDMDQEHGDRAGSNLAHQPYVHSSGSFAVLDLWYEPPSQSTTKKRRSSQHAGAVRVGEEWEVVAEAAAEEEAVKGPGAGWVMKHKFKVGAYDHAHHKAAKAGESLMGRAAGVASERDVRARNRPRERTQQLRRFITRVPIHFAATAATRPRAACKA